MRRKRWEEKSRSDEERMGRKEGRERRGKSIIYNIIIIVV